MKCVHLVSDKWEELDWQSYNQYSNHDGRDKGNTKINVGSSSSSGGVSSKKRRSDPTEYVASMSQEVSSEMLYLCVLLVRLSQIIRSISTDGSQP